MKLLLDENLPPQVAVQLQELFPGTMHVRDVGLKGQPDEWIWKYAQEHHFTILTKDSDFHERSIMHGSPPKVIWIRIGNCTMKLLLEWITEASEVMQNFDQEDASVLVIESR